jgi:hypothetical protein
MFSAKSLAKKIEILSEKINDEHYGISGRSVHYTGGSDHNDDRLVCRVLSHRTVEVTDGNCTEKVTTDDLDTTEKIESYVEDWMADIMA